MNIYACLEFTSWLAERTESIGMVTPNGNWNKRVVRKDFMHIRQFGKKNTIDIDCRVLSNSRTKQSKLVELSIFPQIL